MDANLFSGVVHQLVVCTAEYFPVTGEGGMRDDEVTRRITISISNFGVMDTGAISRGGLGVNRSTTIREEVYEIASYLNHHLIGTMSVGNEVGLD